MLKCSLYAKTQPTGKPILIKDLIKIGLFYLELQHISERGSLCSEASRWVTASVGCLLFLILPFAFEFSLSIRQPLINPSSKAIDYLLGKQSSLCLWKQQLLLCFPVASDMLQPGLGRWSSVLIGAVSLGRWRCCCQKQEEHRQVVSEAAVKDVSEHIIQSPETSRLAAPDALSEADLFLAHVGLILALW